MSGRKFGGYGRGWGEEKAAGPWRRFRQIGREPATKTTYLVALIILIVGTFCIFALVPHP